MGDKPGQQGRRREEGHADQICFWLPNRSRKVSRLSRLSAAARPLEKKPPPYRFSPSAVTAARCSTVVIGFTGLLLYLA
jgi:hypothetical protein